MYAEWRVLWAWSWELGTDKLIPADNYYYVDIKHMQSSTDNDYRPSW